MARFRQVEVFATQRTINTKVDFDSMQTTFGTFKRKEKFTEIKSAKGLDMLLKT